MKIAMEKSGATTVLQKRPSIRAPQVDQGCGCIVIRGGLISKKKETDFPDDFPFWNCCIHYLRVAASALRTFVCILCDLYSRDEFQGHHFESFAENSSKAYITARLEIVFWWNMKL